MTQLPSSNRSWQEAQEAYDRLVPGYVKAGLMDGIHLGIYEYQCVAWAWFRMRELGYKGSYFALSGHDFSYIAGNLGGNSSTEPKLGAVVASSGHVFIVEEIQRDAAGHVIRARYSEMNSGRHQNDTRAPDADSNGNFIKASPDEFRSKGWIKPNGDGSYTREGRTETLIIANPDYGGAFD